MKSIHDFIVKPIKGRYNNTVKLNEVDLIVNTRIEEFKNVSKVAEVVALPLAINTKIKVGDKVVVHHNVFRRWHDVKGIERNSKSYFNESTYFINPDQIFLYKRNKKWIAPKGYCFIKPLKAIDQFNIESE